VSEGSQRAGPEAPVTLPLDGVLDLHTFHPRELSALIPAYLEACQAEGILSLRIIHGKGRGVQRDRVAALLSAHPAVRSFGPGAEGSGGWGATLAELWPQPSPGSGA